MAQKRSFDPRLVIDANRSFSFIFRSFEAFRTKPDLSVGSMIRPHISGGHCDLINPGLVLAACYIYFVYPREAIESIDLSGIDLSSFRISPQIGPNEVLRRLRNSLSHGRFEIDEAGIFTFREHKADGTDLSVVQVHFADLGTFVDAFGRRACDKFRSPGEVVH